MLFAKEAFIEARAFLTRLSKLLAGEAYQRPAAKRIILFAACAAFLGGIFLAISASPDALQNLRWRPLAVFVAFAMPATMILNAIEFALSARLIGQSVTARQAFETTVIGTAANLLPIPGAAIVRIGTLKSSGATVTQGAYATAFTAIVFLGISSAYAGAWLLMLGLTGEGSALLIAGMGVLTVSCWIAWRLLHAPLPAIAIAANRFGLVLLDVMRTYLAFAALGETASFGQASILSLSTVLGASVAIIPAGLGIREGIAALMAPLIGLHSATTYLATSLSRIVGLIVVLATGAALAILTRRAVHQ